MTDVNPLADLRQELVRIGRRIFDRGLAPATSGNISARLPGSNEVLIKRTGVSLGDVEPDDFLLVDLEGNVLEGNGRPSKEYRFHLGLYRAFPDVNAVVHEHSPYATAYACAGRTFPIVTVAGEFGLNEVPLVGYAPPGLPELTEMVLAAFARGGIRAVLLARHGVVTVGADLRQAFYLADLVEDTARVAFIAGLLGTPQL